MSYPFIFPMKITIYFNLRDSKFLMNFLPRSARRTRRINYSNRTSILKTNKNKIISRPSCPSWLYFICLLTEEILQLVAGFLFFLNQAKNQHHFYTRQYDVPCSPGPDKR